MSFFNTGRKIVAIGRNYVDHAKELGNEVPKAPFFFLKPTTSYLQEGNHIILPPGTEVHHEVELGVVIGQNCSHIKQKQDAINAIKGYTLALDLTARNLQQIAKEKGLPWSAAKGYDTFCPVSDFIPKEKIPDPQNIELWLKVNNIEKQRGSTNLMIFQIPELIIHISSIMTLQEDDVILTGTPSGVGPIVSGDKITCGITDIIDMEFSAKNFES